MPAAALLAVARRIHLSHPGRSPILDTTSVRDDRVETIFDCPHSFDAKLVDPASSKLFEDLCAEREHLFAAGAPHEQRSSGIVLAGSPRDVAHLLERTGGRQGLQTMCEGGGQANVTIIERI